jgi:hypothetical protein
MFATINNPVQRWPLFASLIANSFVLLVLAAGPARWLPSPRAKLVPLDLSVYMLTPVSMPSRPQASSPAIKKARPQRQRQEEQIVGHSASVVEGSARWRSLAELGQNSDLYIVAQTTLPMLKARGVVLAFDTHRPRGNTYLLDSRSRTIRYGLMPEDVVVRDLALEPSDFEAERKQVEKYFGAQVKAYALYPPELYNVMKGLTLEALRVTGSRLDAVKAVNIQVQLINQQDFMVTIIG